MIVDCHTHIENTADDVKVSEHLAAAETVDKCIVLACPDGARPDVNKRLSEHVGGHRGKMVGFAVLDPTQDKTGVKSVSGVAEKLSLSGVVLYCSSGGFHPAHSRAMRLYESAEELGLPVFFHNGGSLQPKAVSEYAQPYLLDEVGRAFPSLKVVIGSMGEPFLKQTLSMVKKHPNIYADLSIRPGRVWEVYNTVVAAYEHGVMDKLLFGSGFPSGDAGEWMETLLGFNKLLGDTSLPAVPRGEIRNIIERDAFEVLGIKVDG